eukprot:IDg8533t1
MTAFQLCVLLVSYFLLSQALVSALPLNLKTDLSEHFDGGPCVLQWGGYVSNPRGIVIEIGKAAPHHDKFCLQFPYSPRRDYLNPLSKSYQGYCKLTRANKVGGYEMIARRACAMTSMTRPCYIFSEKNAIHTLSMLVQATYDAIQFLPHERLATSCRFSKVTSNRIKIPAKITE